MLININKYLLIITLILLSYIARGEESTTDHQQHHLDNTYPVNDRQWSIPSIPSIRLTNYINPSSNGYPHNYSFTSYANYSKETDNDGASFNKSYSSFWGDDDDTRV